MTVITGQPNGLILMGQDLVVISFRRFATTLEYGTDKLFRNFGKSLPKHAVK